MSHRTMLAFVAAAAAVLLPALATAQDSERWYEIWLSGARSGYSRETRVTEGDRVITRVYSTLAIRRAESTIEIETTTEFIETVDGRAIEMALDHKMGQTSQKTRYVFGEESVIMTADATPGETELPLPDGRWLPPAAAEAYFKQRFESGADRIVVRSIDATNGLTVAETTRTEFRPETIDVGGRSVDATRCDSVLRAGPTPIRATEFFNSEGELLRSEAMLGELEFTQIASDERRALMPTDPAEVMVSTFVRPNRPIRGARSTTRAVYEVRLPDGVMPELPESGYQSVDSIDDSAAVVTVDLNAAHPAGSVEREDHLEATTYANKDDELIIELTEEALEGVADDAMTRAEAIRRFVFDHIETKDLGTAFATASETARTCEGDCSEHGVLFAAMLRAAGIPSRVAVGVVYVDRFAGERDVFGYHMWTQALIDTEDGPSWIDLDATLNERAAYDATHIAFAATKLADGEALTSLAAITPMLGVLEIEVKEIK